jgi:Ser/Thr protein kinase RdoA (MazF antagonist)
MKLNPENQINLNKETLDKMLKAYNIFDFTFESIKQGIENSSAFIENNKKKYVLRVYAQGKKDENIAFEINFQDYLREHGMPIPIIYKNNDGEELTIIEIDNKRWQVVLMDFVEGKNVTTKPSYDLISELAQMQAKMHLLGIEFAKLNPKPIHLWTDLHDRFASKINKIPDYSQEVLDLIERIKKYNYPLNSELPYGYNHLDIDFDGNVITKDNKINGVIDFDDLKYSPIIVCLGYSLWNILNDQGIESMKYYLNEYEKVRPLNAVEYEALPNVVFFRNYVMAVIWLLFWEKNTSMKNIQDVLKLEKEILIILNSLK